MNSYLPYFRLPHLSHSFTTSTFQPCKDLLKNHGERKIQDVTVEMAINGARAVKSMVTETSDLDANTGSLGWEVEEGDPLSFLPKNLVNFQWNG